MFENSMAFSSFSVEDIEEAKNFYQKKLGLRVEEDPMGFIELFVGDLRIIVYGKPDHTPASFTVLNFPVNNIDKAVQQLRTHDIRMEDYPHLQTDKNGISRGPGPLIAWFKDPAGNILSVIEIQDL